MLIYAISIAFLAWGLTNLKGKGMDISLAGLWNMGFGTLDPRSMALGSSGNESLQLATLLANIPQVFLAAIYLVFNGLIVAMFTAQDWHKFGVKSQTLMVSSPRYRQRGTWIFGAPVLYGVIFLALQAVLHWLCSQSLFLIQIDIVNIEGQDNTATTTLHTNCGYSSIAGIFTLIIGMFIPVSALFLGLRKLHGSPGPPLVSTCSTAISAACHPRHLWEDGMWNGELRWGAHRTVVDQHGWGHCSLAPARHWGAAMERPTTNCGYR